MSDDLQCNDPDPRTWWNSYTFPLVPVLRLRKSVKPQDTYDSGTTTGFTFSWLFLTVWTLDNVHFELAIVADTHWGIGLTGILPYLRWKLTIPCPQKFGFWFDRITRRNP